MLPAAMVDGRGLVTMLLDAPDFHSIVPDNLGELPRPAQDTFAAITDFLRDSMDVSESRRGPRCSVTAAP